jgi:hypothetical protein
MKRSDPFVASDFSSIIQKPDLLFLISRNLDPTVTLSYGSSFSQLAAVSKNWRLAFQCEDLWCILCEARWPGMTTTCQVAGGYKRLFKRLNVRCANESHDISMFEHVMMMLEHGKQKECFDLGKGPVKYHAGFGRYLEIALPTKWKLEYICDKEEWKRQNQEWIDDQVDNNLVNGAYFESYLDWVEEIVGGLVCKRDGRAVALKGHWCERATMDDPNGFFEIHWAALPVAAKLQDDVRKCFGLADPETQEYSVPALCVSLAFFRGTSGVLGLKLDFKEYVGNESVQDYGHTHTLSVHQQAHILRAGEALLPYLRWL